MKTFEKPRLADSAKTLEGSWYASAEVFARERERVFAQSWICIGRAGQLANKGDYVLADVAGESIIVTRDSSGIRAFHNVCRHRGTRICAQESGRFAGAIQCPYHAWTYALDGTLTAARNMQDVPGFEKADYPLKKIALKIEAGFVFVNLDPVAQAFPHSASFAGFADWDLASLRVAHATVYDLACNWKLVFQNYSECYHCPLVHPQLDKLSPSDSGRNDLSEGAVLGGFSEFRPNVSGLSTSGQRTRPPLGTVAGEELNRVYYYTIFPSMALSLHADYAMVHYMKPLAPNRTQVICEWLFDARTMAQPGFDPTDVVEFWDLTNRQDWNISEYTQLGVESRAYTPGPYANAESLLAAFDRHYLLAMNAPA